MHCAELKWTRTWRTLATVAPGANPALALLLIAGTLCGCRTFPPNSLVFHNPSKWEQDIAAFEAADQTNPPPAGSIVFTGSSSIRMWTGLSNDFAGLPVVNRGFGGSQIADLVHYEPRIITRYKPRQVVIYSGGNDLNAGKAPEIVYGDFVALVRALREKLPRTEIAYIAVAPNKARWDQVEKVSRLNSMVREYCEDKGLVFIDVFPLMLGPDGLPKAEIYLEDNLHLNRKGYDIWTAEVRKHLLQSTSM